MPYVQRCAPDHVFGRAHCFSGTLANVVQPWAYCGHICQPGADPQPVASCVRVRARIACACGMRARAHALPVRAPGARDLFLRKVLVFTVLSGSNLVAKFATT